MSTLHFSFECCSIYLNGFALNPSSATETIIEMNHTELLTDKLKVDNISL